MVAALEIIYIYQSYETLIKFNSEMYIITIQ